MTIETIALIHPPHPDSTEDCLDPPLGLAYVASAIRRAHPNDIEVKIIDLSGTTEDDWELPYADLYGLTVYAPTMDVSMKIIRKCNELNPSAVTVVGGAHPTAVPDCFRGVVDHVAIGRGEGPILQIIDGNAEFHADATYTNDFFQTPSFDLLDLSRYKRTIGGRKSLPVLTTRGCPYKCAFCGLALEHSNGILFQNPESLVQQIRHYIDAHGITAFGFQDDIFTMNKTRLRRILDLIKPLDIRFRCHGRAGMDDEETYAWLADAGCIQVAWGIESGSQRILDMMNKRVTVQDSRNVIAWAKKYGIDSRAFFIIGFPGETAESINETKQFIESADPDQYFASSFVPYPGTDVWNNPSKYGVTDFDTDFSRYYQVNEAGFGGMTIDTIWTSAAQMRDIERDFRSWLRNRVMRGYVLEYEKK